MTSPNDKVSIGTNVYGRTSWLDRRSAAHLEATRKALPAGCTLLVIQGGWNTGVAASAGTHDYGAVVDVKVAGMSWPNAQTFMRRHGWAAWYRRPPTFSTEHIHAVSLGYSCRVGRFVPGQVDDYMNHRTGLVGHVRDYSWFPPNIAATVFDYDAYLEEDMPLSDEDITRIAEAVWQRPIHSADERQASSALAQIYAWLKGMKK